MFLTIRRLEKLEMDIQAALKEFDAAADRGEKIDTGMTLECGSVCLALSSDDRWNIILACFSQSIK